MFTLQCFKGPELPDYPLGGWSNPFAFGGGYRFGGLNEKIVAELAPIMTPVYMGAAEFEYGALPKAIQAMATPGNLYVELEWDIKHKGKTVRVYVFCRERQMGFLNNEIPKLMNEKKEHLVSKHGTGFASAVRLWPESRTRAWLEVGEASSSPDPFFLTLDGDMLEKFVTLMRLYSTNGI